MRDHEAEDVEPGAADVSKWAALRDCPEWPGCDVSEIRISGMKLAALVEFVEKYGLDPGDVEFVYHPEKGVIATFSCFGSDVCAHACGARREADAQPY